MTPPSPVQPPLTEPTEDALDRIANAQWHYGGQWHRQPPYDGVTFLDIHEHNACNHTLSGTIDVDGRLYGFIVESGDWNSTVVKAWGDPEDVSVYQPEPPGEQLTFVPIHRLRPAMRQVYLWWREQEWFKEKERAYLYDRHFAPGDFTERHYHNWAAPKGMTIGLLSNVDLTSEESPVTVEQMVAAWEALS